ncbi:ABC transporter permease [Bifidobacterium samirii]|uniref:ABC transporter permease n=1 Tax=Bifidobacterium samirii TaxID=2306974 RepID=A0A430FGQ7_9BIFI|nr:FtsX-like permease family protein [Bifidobacterium samirii]RSX52085.1 ABC transporter permease [Bifidobacterium samirii]
MFSITLKLMRRNMRMLIPAGIAILIGTAFIAATFLFGNSMNDALARQRTAQYGEANFSVMADLPSDASDERIQTAYERTVGDFHLDQMAAVDGVAGVRAEATAQIVVSKGDVHVSGMAVATSADAKLLPVDVADGAQPDGDGGIALPKGVASQLGVGIGDDVTVTSLWADPMTLRVTGLTDDPDGSYSYYGGASVLSDDAMAAMNGVGSFDEIICLSYLLDIPGAGADGTRPDIAAKQAIDKVEVLLPDDYRLIDRAELDRMMVDGLTDSAGTGVFTTFLLSFGILALLVAALVIANTFQVLVAQRRRTLALLRTIGAKKGQLYASVLFEAGVLGLVASILGTVTGCGLMAALCASGLMKATGFYMRFVASWPVFVVPLAFGIVVTVLAAIGSARSATAVTPLEALRPIELTDTRRAGRIRLIASVAMALIGVIAAALAAWQIHEMTAGRDSLATGNYSLVLLAAIGGCALVFVALVLSAAFWMPRLMRGVGGIVAKVGPSATIAHANIQKNPRRVAATGAALLIGVTLVATIATGATSAKQTMGEALATRYSVDMVAIGSDMTERQADDAGKVKGVTHAVYAPATLRYTTDKDGDALSVLLVGVRSVDELKMVMHADLGSATIDGDDVIMSTYSAFSGKKIAFGKDDATFTEEYPGGESGGADSTDSADSSAGTAAERQPLTLKPVQADFRRVSGSYDLVAFVSADHFTDHRLAADMHMLLMSVDADKAGTTLNDTLSGVQNAFSGAADVQVTGPIAERATWENSINAMMALLVGLIAVAVLIALVGVANTLSLSVIERTRESATLRAIGMTRGQLRRSLAVEALLLSLVAGVVGVIVGTLFGWLGSYMVFSLYGQVVFPFEWTANGTVLAVAAIAALVASVAPARRAVRTPPVEALAEA